MNSLFYVFSTGAWLSAAMVIRSKNPVHSVFYLVLVFLNASALLFLLDMEFFALMQLLVYVGALAILFLFVVMLLDIPVTEIVAHQRGSFGISTMFIFILFCFLLLLLIQPFQEETLLPFLPIAENLAQEIKWIEWTSLATQKENLAQLGFSLYRVYVDLLIIASLLLLVAMIGAVVLTLKKKLNAPSHDIFAQHHRDFQKVVYLTQKREN
jgi:NADH-quinone oxidoreductase subunit J